MAMVIFGTISLSLLITRFCPGQPIAWCITDRECHITVKHFLQSIKDQSPEKEIKVLMTDDGEYTYLLC